MNLYYDSYSGAGPNIAGRLAASFDGQVTEFQATPAGLLTTKQMSITNWASGTLTYAYNNEGRRLR